MESGLRCIFRLGGPVPPLPEGDFPQDHLETSCSQNDMFGQRYLLQLFHEVDLPQFHRLLWICSLSAPVDIGVNSLILGARCKFRDCASKPKARLRIEVKGRKVLTSGSVRIDKEGSE